MSPRRAYVRARGALRACDADEEQSRKRRVRYTDVAAEKEKVSESERAKARERERERELEYTTFGKRQMSMLLREQGCIVEKTAPAMLRIHYYFFVRLIYRESVSLPASFYLLYLFVPSFSLRT